MMHRIRKEDDLNAGKWIGVGGKFRPGESPEDCLLREVREETGLTLTAYRFCGIITFVYNENEAEYMHLYSASDYVGTLVSECAEGVLQWVPVEDLRLLNLWEGDRIFLRLLSEERPFFSLKLVYRGDHLLKAVLDGHPLPL